MIMTKATWSWTLTPLGNCPGAQEQLLPSALLCKYFMTSPYHLLSDKQHVIILSHSFTLNLRLQIESIKRHVPFSTQPMVTLSPLNPVQLLAVAWLTQIKKIYLFLFVFFLFYSNSVFVPNQGSRENVRKVLIVITDGESQEKYQLPSAVQEAENKKIVRFAIGVSVIYIFTLWNIT